MSSCTMTLIGVANYMQQCGDDLFKKLVVPSGVDKTTLTNTIILRGAEFEVLYSNPYFFQEAIGTWSAKWNRTMKKWAEALAIDYNPLENYDRMEEWNTQDNGSTHSTSSGNDTSNANTSSTAENKTSAFNSSEYQPDNSSTSGANSSNTSNTSMTADGTASNTNVRTGRAHGNIGVTTSQQMLQSELDIATWNLYEHIADIFLQEFVLPIY